MLSNALTAAEFRCPECLDWVARPINELQKNILRTAGVRTWSEEVDDVVEVMRRGLWSM
jgi:hypothetical protein